MREVMLLFFLGCLSAWAEVPWPVSDGVACRVCVMVCDDSAWTLVGPGGGVPVVRGPGHSCDAVWLILPAGEFSYVGSTNWSCSLAGGHTVYLGSDVAGNPVFYDDDTLGRKAGRLSMVMYGFSTFAGFWLVGLMLRMLPRQPNVGDV